MTTRDRPLQILLVEDQRLNRELVRAILARSRQPSLDTARIIEAETLAQAELALANEHIDVILLDVNLPDGSGLTIASKLNSTPADRRPAIIALTAGALPQQNAAALAAGCDAILTKPHTAAELLAVLSTHLPQRSTTD